MPRKTKEDSIDKKLVAEAFAEISMLLGDQVAMAVAEMVHQDLVTDASASQVPTVLQATAADCINKVRAARGL